MNIILGRGYVKTYYIIKGPKRVRIREFIKKAAAVLLVILIIEAGIFLLRSINVNIVVAKWGFMEKGYWAEALIIQRETVLRAPLAGNLEIQAESGARVPRDELLLYINTDQPIDTSELNIKTKMELESLVREEKAFRADLERIEFEIKEIRALMKKSPKKSKDINPVITALRKEKTRVTKTIQTTHRQFLELRRKVQEQLGQQALVMSPEPGYVYYQTDGWEEKLSLDNLQNIQEQDIRRNYSLKSSGKKVNTGEVIGKIISPFEQIIMVLVDINITGLPEPGEVWWLKTSHGLQRVNVKKATQISDYKAMVALVNPSFRQDHLPNRRAKVYLIYRRISGVSVPRRAIFNHKGVTSVKILKGDGFDLKKIRVIDVDDNNAIIDGLEFGTTIISR